MTFNKNKVIALAQKYVQKGQIDRAVKEYQKVLDEDKKDIRTRLKIGDLLAKKGDLNEAVKVYQEAAEYYSKDGFFLKAVAVYKNVLKLSPDLIEVNLKLGDLYRQLSLLVDAMAQYQIVVNFYDRKGMVKEALDTLKKMVELDPENVTFKINLAELYHKEGHVDQARTEYDTIARELKAAGKEEELAKVYERILHHQAERHDVIKDLARVYLKQRQGQKALAKLQVCFKADPKDAETLELLAESFMLLDQPKKAKSVYKELVLIYDTTGKQAEKKKALENLQIASPGEDLSEFATAADPEPPPPVIAPAPNRKPAPPASLPAEVTRYDEEVTEFSIHTGGSPLNPLEEAPPINLEGFSPLAPVEDLPQEVAVAAEEPMAGEPVLDLGESGADDNFENLDEEISKLLTETDVYMKYGLNDKAKEHLELILSKRPKHLEARKKLKDLCLAFGDKTAAISHAKELVRYAQESGDAAQAKEFQKDLEALDSTAAKEVAAKSSPNIKAAKAGAVKIAPQPKADESALEIAPEAVDVEEMQLDLSEDLMQDEPAPQESEEPVMDLSESLPDPIADSSMENAEGPAIEMNDLDLGIEVDLSESPEFEAPETPLQEAAADDAPEEIADEIEEEVMEASADDAHVDESLAGLKPPAFSPLLESEEAVEIPIEVREELDEAEFFVQQGLHDEARKIFEDLLKRFPTHEGVQEEVNQRLTALGPEEGSSVKVAITEAPARSAPPPSGDAEEISFKAAKPQLIVQDKAVVAQIEEEMFDLAAELSEELESAATEQPAVSEESDEVDFRDVFEEFKKGVASQLGHEDSETHFDLGLAYKEMHLLDDAIHEFEIAQADAKKSVESLTMIGLCYMDKGEFDEAANYFRKGLASKSIGTQEIVGMNYELGMALQAAGHAAQALEAFEKVHGLDPTFRDVVQRLDEVGASSGGTPAAEDEPAAPEEMGDDFDLGRSLAIDEEAEESAAPVKAVPAKPKSSRQPAELTDEDAFDTPSEKSESEPPVKEIRAPVSKPVGKKPATKAKNKISYV